MNKTLKADIKSVISQVVSDTEKPFKKLFIAILTVLLTSCNGVGLGVGVAVSGDTIADGASWLSDNIGTILLVVFVLIAIVFMVVFIGVAIEEKQNSTQTAKKVADECIVSGIKDLEYESTKIKNVKEKLYFFISRYKEEGRPRGISITMYSALHCEKNAEFYIWLFDDPALMISQPEKLDKNHSILFNAFKMIAEDQYMK